MHTKKIVIVKKLPTEKAYTKYRLFSFVFILSLTACTTPNKTYLVSGIDSQHRIKKTQVGSTNAVSTSVNVYQSIVSRTLASECVYSPSDSAYSQIVSKKCGSVVSLMKTFDRFLRESDIAFVGSAMIPSMGEYKFLDIPEDCEYF